MNFEAPFVGVTSFETGINLLKKLALNCALTSYVPSLKTNKRKFQFREVRRYEILLNSFLFACDEEKKRVYEKFYAHLLQTNRNSHEESPLALNIDKLVYICARFFTNVKGKLGTKGVVF